MPNLSLLGDPIGGQVSVYSEENDNLMTDTRVSIVKENGVIEKEEKNEI